MTPSGSVSNQPSRLEVLLLDYEMAREDERSLISAQATALSVAVTLIAGIAALLTQTCQFQTGRVGCSRVPDAVLAGAPLAPLALLAFLQMLGTVATLRSYYLRALEAELRLWARGDLAELPAVQPASFSELVIEVTSLRRGRAGHRFLAFLILAILLVVFGGLTLLIALHVHVGVRLAMVVVYGGSAAVLIREAVQMTIGGRSIFMKLVHNYAHRRRRNLVPDFPQAAPARPGRTLLSYVVIPRPRDAIKWLFFPATFGLAVWARGGASGGRVRDGLLLLIVLEYFIYSARYQWNDVRGFVEDGTHPDWFARGRLPHGPTCAESRRNIMTSVTVATGRLLLAVVIGVLRPHLLLGIVVLIAAVFMTAAVYERLKVEHRVVAVWLFVGVGYAVRGVAGFVAGGLSWSSEATITGAGVLVALGVAFVTMTWALEALSHCQVADSVLLCSPDLQEKPHLYRLLAFMSVPPLASAPAVSARGADPEKYSGSREHGLEARGRILAPWNQAIVIASVCGGVAGVALGHAVNGRAAATVCAAVAGAVLAGLLVAARRSLVRIAAVALGVAFFWILGVFSSARPTLLVAVPYAIIATVFVWFRAQSYESLTAGLAPIVKALAGLAHRTFAWVIGSRTARAVGFLPAETPAEMAPGLGDS